MIDKILKVSDNKCVVYFTNRKTLVIITHNDEAIELASMLADDNFNLFDSGYTLVSFYRPKESAHDS